MTSVSRIRGRDACYYSRLTHTLTLLFAPTTEDWVDSLPDDDLKSRIIFGGPCILVEGEELAQAEGKL